MTFGAGTFGSLSPFMLNRGQPVQRPTGPTNLAQQMMGGQQGQGFGSFSPMPQHQPQQAAAAQPSAGGRIPVSGLGGPGLQSLFAEADKAVAAANNPGPYDPTKFLTGSPPKTAEEAWAQQQADQKALDLQQYKFALMQWGQNGKVGPEPTGPMRTIAENKLQKDMFFRNFNGSSGLSPGTTEASAAAQKEAEAFLKSLGL